MIRMIRDGRSAGCVIAKSSDAPTSEAPKMIPYQATGGPKNRVLRSAGATTATVRSRTARLLFATRDRLVISGTGLSQGVRGRAAMEAHRKILGGRAFV